ncbi:MAG: hypothetical protein MI724_07110 [Spirochaetales bacterium]|nr:hypothetical protein [Spirochaetales bacterium]
MRRASSRAAVYRRNLIRAVMVCAAAVLSVGCATLLQRETESYSFQTIATVDAFRVELESFTVDGLAASPNLLRITREILDAEALRAGLPVDSGGSTIVVSLTQTSFSANLRVRNAVIVTLAVVDGDGRTVHRVITTATITQTVESPHHLRRILRRALDTLGGNWERERRDLERG